MPSGINYYAFCADYSDVANCLFAIQAIDDNGGFANDPEALRLLRIFQDDVLRKLYTRTIRVLSTLEGFTISEQYLLGDFEEADFTGVDFNVGFTDDRNTSYSSLFQTILNIFAEFCSRSSELSAADIQSINDAFIPVWDAYLALQAHLIAAGHNPCNAVNNTFNNSTSLYLQAAGSDGSDGVATGMHLRWSLTGDLGNNHVPQGDYYDTHGGNPTGFNRLSDYVTLSRTPYVNPVPFTIDFETAFPAIDYFGKRWTYVIKKVDVTPNITNKVRITFTDTDAYDQVAVTINARTNPFEFLKAYNGLFEVQIDNKQSFAIGYDFRQAVDANNSSLKIEALSMSDIDGVAGETINIRKTVTAVSSDPVTGTILGDNISRVRFKKSEDGYLQSFTFETYADFVSSRPSTAWTVVGNNFGLSLDDSTVYKRLEAPEYPIDNLWPQYNDGTKVKVANYRDKWFASYPDEPALSEIVGTYLSLSETDPRAQTILTDGNPDPIEIPISYVDVLNMLATDYHKARMLGMGHIDTQVNTQGGQYIYKISYTNLPYTGASQATTMEYLGLPTALTDSRLPSMPALKPITYGLTVQNELSQHMFDSNGYGVHEKVRLVNISRQGYTYEQPNPSFFDDVSVSDNFNIFSNTVSLFYGLEYRSASSQTYQKPELANDNPIGNVYYAYDAGSAEPVPETALIPDNDTSLYTHFEKTKGVHYYAIYGVNWFSRSSALSDEVATDDTEFPLKNTLQPPATFAAQYIQQEDTLVFTTQTEQDWLTGRTAEFEGQDVNFTRVTFNWLDLSDVSDVDDEGNFDYTTLVKPTRVKAWFKPGQPLQVMGAIQNVLPVDGQDLQLELYTGSYTMIDGSLADPTTANADLGKFTGSLLITPEGQFPVVSVAQGTSGPVFTVEKVTVTTNVEDDTDPGYYTTVQNFVSPAAGSRFTVTENLTDPTNWQTVTEDIQLVNYVDPEHRNLESSIDDQGNLTSTLAGGLYGKAVIEQLRSIDDNSVLPGFYSVTFDPSITLAPHPQANPPYDPASPGANAPGTLHSPHVEWYKGLVRIPLADGSDKKTLEVMRIFQTEPLVLYTYDAGYQDAPIQLSTTETNQVNNVNFHPGYRAYLYPEPAPDNTFNGVNMLPGVGVDSKKTMIGLQTTDTGTGGTGFVSKVSPPAILLASKIIKPVQLDAPLTHGLKVRPDVTTKAAFTFDMKIAPDSDGQARNPFGFMFYRTTNEDLLEALYSPDTITTILADLAALTTDDHYDQRYLELANLTFDPASPGNFNVFDALPAPYGFPVPDKIELALVALYKPETVTTILAALAALETDEHYDERLAELVSMTFDPANPGHFRVFDALPQPYGFPVPDKTPYTQAQKKQLYQMAVQSTLLPLTEQTPIYSFIKKGTQTENTLPKIRSIDGNLLDPTDQDFNPFPMVRKYPVIPAEDKITYVRFTDYSLNGSARFLYFYGAAEVTNQLAIGPVSPFAGPVTVLHTLPAEEPIVRYFTLGPPTTISDSPVAVTFYVSPFSSEDPITKVRLYRTYDQSKAISLRTMDSYAEADVVLDPQYGIVVTDTFDLLPAIPYGEIIYYRLAFVRTIINEFEQSEDVIGLGSDIITVNLIDTNNPDAPQLSYDQTGNSLSWPPTTNKGIYYLYQQNSKGNWQQIHSVQPTSPTDTMEYLIPAPLPSTDADGNPLYYRFKVKVQNSSGLFNLVDNELTV